MCYYTITSDLQTKGGHTQALMIIDAENTETASQEYVKTFNLTKFDIIEGIKIQSGFEELIPAPIKKMIAKYKSGNSDVALISYCNSIHTKYLDE